MKVALHFLKIHEKYKISQIKYLRFKILTVLENTFITIY